jgi:hypothetical protein
MTDFDLTPAPLPASRRPQRRSIYLQMLERFADMKEKSVRVDCQRAPATVYGGLAAALKRSPQHRGIAVKRRGSEVYLVNK